MFRCFMPVAYLLNYMQSMQELINHAYVKSQNTSIEGKQEVTENYGALILFCKIQLKEIPKFQNFSHESDSRLSVVHPSVC